MTGYAASVTVYRGSGIVDAKGMVAGPYPGSVNGQDYDLFCDDAAHDIVAQDSVKMTVSTLSDLSHTRFGKKMNAEVMYEQIFYLSTYLLSPPKHVPYTSDTNQPVAADIQDAIWSYFDPNSDESGSNSVKYWRNLAARDYDQGNYCSFRILTDSMNPLNGVQELFFNSAVPTAVAEPSLQVLFLVGLIAALVCRKRLARRLA